MGSNTTADEGPCTLASSYGTMFYNTTTNSVYVCTSTGWIPLGSGGGGSDIWTHSGTYDYLTTTTDNVGIGTTTPSNNLYIYSTAYDGGITVDGTTSPAITLDASGVNDGFVGVATASNSYTTGSASGDIVVRSNHNLLFGVNGGGTTSMYLSNTGNVGIGNTSPSAALDIQLPYPNVATQGLSVWKFYGGVTTTNPVAGFYATDGGINAGINFISKGSGGWLPDAYMMDVSDRYGNMGALHVDSYGNVGIDTTSPVTTLEVDAGSDTTQILWGEMIRNWGNANVSGYGTGIAFKNSDSNSWNEQNKWAGIAGIATDTWSNSTGLAFYTNQNTGSAPPIEKMRLDQYGELGIGTQGPMTLLDVNGSASSGWTNGNWPVAVFGSEGAGVSISEGWPQINFNDYYDGSNSRSLATGYGGGIYLDESMGGMRFWMADTVTGAGTKQGYAEAMYLTADSGGGWNDASAEINANAVPSNGNRGGSALILNRGSLGRDAAQVIYATGNATYNWYEGLTYDCGLLTPDFTISQVAVLNDCTTIHEPEFVLSSSSSQGGDIAAEVHENDPAHLGIVRAFNSQKDDTEIGRFGTSAGAYGSILAGEGYLYSDAGGLSIAADKSSGVIKFATGASIPERMRIDSGGQVGIGTTTPNTSLEIDKSVVSGLGPILTLNNPGGSAGAGASIDFDNYGYLSNPGARIRSFDDGDYGSHLLFLTKPAGSVANTTTEQMRITDGGSVGIGTQTPLTLLDVNGTGSGSWWVTGGDWPVAVFGSDSTGVTITENWPTIGFDTYYSGLASSFVSLNSGYGGGIGMNEDDGSMGFWTIPYVTGVGTPQSYNMDMTILGNGNVGIGTTAPNSTLEVNGWIEADNTLYVGQDLFMSSDIVPANNDQRFSIGAGIFWDTTNNDYYVADTAYDQGSFSNENGTFVWTTHQAALTSPQTYAQWHAFDRMFLNDNGLGLGGYADDFFTINGGASDWSEMHFEDATTGETGGLRIGNTYGDAWITKVDNGYMLFATDNAERMRIAANGKVGIGTTTPSTALQVAGTVTDTGEAITGTLSVSSTVAFTGLSAHASAAGYYTLCIDAPTGAGTLVYNTAACTNSSDARLKTDIVDLPSDEGLAAIMKLHPVAFRFKDATENKLKGPQIGLLAQEVKPVLPRLVMTGGDAEITLDNGSKQTIKNAMSVVYERLPLILIKAVQELKTLFDSDHGAIAKDQDNIAKLKADNDNLRAEIKADNDNLQAEIEELKSQVAKGR